MANTFLFDVFLSHNNIDKARIRRLAKRLKDAGLRVWFDEDIIKPGDDIYLAIERGLEVSRVQVLCLSQAALASEWVRLERSTVLFRDPSNMGRRFVPLLLSDCEMPDTLRRYKYIDYRKETKASLEELLNACATEGVPSDEPETAELTSAAQRDNASNEHKIATSSAYDGQHKAITPSAPSLNAAESGEVHALLALDQMLEADGKWVPDLVIGPDGNMIVAASFSTLLRFWNPKTGKRLATQKGHKDKINCVAISPDGRTVASGSNDGTIRLWDAATQICTKLKKLENEPYVTSMCFAPTKSLLFVTLASPKYNVLLWDIDSDSIVWSARYEGPIHGAVVDPRGAFVLCGNTGGEIHRLDLQTGRLIAKISAHSGAINDLAITADSKFVVSCSDDRTLKIWDVENSSCVGTLEGHEASVLDVAISPKTNIVVSAGFVDNSLRFWDIATGTCLQIVKDDGTPVSLSFSPDGEYLAVGGTHGPIKIYRVNTRAAVAASDRQRRYVNAKVVLVGESTVGKTTLAHRLIEDRYVKPDSTHGMSVFRLDLPLDPDDTLEREALLWDLAGQEDYRLIHQIFLEETALALLLVNPQKDDPFAEAVDWLKALRAAVSAKDAQRVVAKLLIPTRLDVGGMKISEKKINRFIADNDIAACLPTSAKRGDNCSDKENGGAPSMLKKLIARHIAWDKLPWTSTPRLLAEIKNAVMAMRDKSDIRLLRLAELTQRLEQAMPRETLTEKDVRTAVTLLANHGLVMLLKFGDLVLLRPELLNGYAAAIIRAARAHKDEIGCVTEEDIYDGSFDFTGVDRLGHRPDEDLLLRALVQTLLDFSLCIREIESGKTLLVFPSQYRRDREIPSHPDIYVSFTFTGELQSIYTTLIVRLWYSRIFDQKELWQNAAEFATSKGRRVGALFEKLGDGKGKLSIFFDSGVPDELKVLFIEFVHRHLRKYGRDLLRERRYVCPGQNCGRPVRDMEAVQERIRARKSFITCSHCDRRVPFKDHIEERLGSDPVARKVLAMEAQATSELDNQALEQILIGHVQAICGEANQIFRRFSEFDYGIDGEIEFKDNGGNASGKKIYVQLKHGRSYLRRRKVDNAEIFDVKDTRHIRYWADQPVDVYLVIRDKNEFGDNVIRWMNVSRYLRGRPDKTSRQIVFEGERLDFETVWRVRDEFFI